MNIHTHLAPVGYGMFGVTFAASGVHKITLALSASGWSSSALAAAEIAAGLVLLVHVLKTSESSPRTER